MAPSTATVEESELCATFTAAQWMHHRDLPESRVDGLAK